MCLLLVGSSSTCLAQDKSGDYVPPTWPAAPTASQLLGRVGLLLVGVLGCAGVALWLARRGLALNPGRELPGSPRIVATLPLPGRCALHLLQVDQAGFVVATDAGGLKAIHLLAEPFAELVDEQLAPETKREPVIEPYADLDCPLAPRRVSLH